MATIRTIQGDITRLEVDAIVNAANRSLLGGGGVDGAIHEAAGPELLRECRTLGGAETGEAKITRGYNLPAKFVIHTPGPVYGQHRGQETVLLRSCYWQSLERADENNVRSIAFPCISTGIFGYPKEEAAKIAYETVIDYLATHESGIEDVIFVTFGKEDTKIYRKLLGTKD